MLPREAYVDPAVFAWEQAHFFSGWVCLGRTHRPRGGRQRSGRSSLGVGRGAADPRPRTACCAPSPTSAGTAGTSCCRAVGSRKSAASSARTTPGRTGWTARCSARRGSATSRASTPAEFGLDRAAGRRLARLGLRRRLRPGRRRSPSTSASSEEIVAPYRAGDAARRWRRTSTSSRPTGRSSSRTTRSATTARRSTPSCARISPPDSGENLDLPGRLGGRLDVAARRAPRRCR